MIYAQQFPTDTLEQGDILRISQEFGEVLEKYHPYYRRHDANKLYVVLTQSCDLVIRNGVCKARYIALAPVRPLRTVLLREFRQTLENWGPGKQPFGTGRAKTSLEQFLGRLFNNNEPNLFYLQPNHQSGIAQEMCAVLSLPISLKPEHYQTLLAAKIAGITDVFQAKLGWLLGQLYSRVGTPDMPSEELAGQVQSYTNQLAVWVDDREFRLLKEQVAEHQSSEGAAPVDTKLLGEMVSKIPKRKKEIVDALIDIVAAQGLVEEERGPNRFRLRKAIERDATLGRLLSK